MADISSPDRVGVKVWPDARKFLGELRREIKKAEKAVKAQIQVIVDDSDLLRETRDTVKRTEKSAPKLKVPAGLEDGFLSKIQKDVKAATSKVEANIPLTAEGERIRRDVRSTVADLQSRVQAMAIEVPLDVEEAASQRAELAAQVARLQSMADAVEVPLDVDGDEAQAGLRSTRAKMQAYASANPVEIPVDIDRKVLGSMPTFGGLPKATAITAIGVAALGSLPAVAALGVGIAQMSGAILALPAVAAIGVASIASVAIGLSGVGDAFKAASKGGEEYREAMEKLSPSARNFVTSVRSMGDGFSALRLDVQQSLFRGLGAEIKALGSTYLPTLKSGLSGVSSALNGVVRDWSEMARTSAAVADTESILGNTKDAIDRASAGLTAFAAGFRRLAEIGSGVLPDLSDKFTTLGERFDAWTAKGQKSGAIEESMRRGGQAAQELISIIGSLGSIIGGVFSAMADASGGDPLGSLSESLKGVAETVNGPAFQTGLSTFFAGMRDGWSSIASGISSLGSALGEIAPGLADFSRAFGAGFGQVLTTIGDLISKHKDTINSFFESFANASPKVQGLAVMFALLAPVIMGAITSLAGVVTSIAGIVGVVGAPALAIAAAVVAIGAGLAILYTQSEPVRELFSQIATTLMPLFKSAFETLAPILQQIGAAFVELGSALAERLMPVFQFLAPYIQTAFQAIVTIVQGVLTVILGVIKFFAAVLRGDWSAAWSALGTILSGVWMIIKGIVQTALNNIKALIAIAWQGIKAATSAAWAAIKAIISAAWMLIKAGVSAQINAIKAVLSAAWAAIRGATSAAWSGIKAAISAAWSGIKAVVSIAVSAVKTAISSAWNTIKSLTSSAWNGIKSFVSNGINGAKAIATSAVNTIKSTVSNAWNTAKSLTSSAWNGIKSTISNAINAAKSAVSNGVGNVVSTVRSIPGKVKSALGNLGNTLKNAGRDLIQGLINGITEKIGALKDKMSSISKTIKDHMPGSPVKEGPLVSWNYGGGVSAAGRRLIGGLAEGMEAESSAVASASRRVATAANVPTDEAAASYASRQSPGDSVEKALSGWQPVVSLNGRDFHGAMQRTTRDREGR